MHWAVKKEKLVVFNLVDLHSLPNCQNKFYAKFSSYTVVFIWLGVKYRHAMINHITPVVPQENAKQFVA